MVRSTDPGAGISIAAVNVGPDVDAAWTFLSNHVEANVETSTISLHAVRRKIDWHIVSLMFACYTMQFFDKVILNAWTPRSCDP